MNSNQATNSRKSRQHTPAVVNRGALLLAAVLTAGSTMAAAQPALHQLAPSSAASASSTGAPSAYGAGGSVYRQQVPAAGWVVDVPLSYFPGGSVYRSQVPREAW